MVSNIKKQNNIAIANISKTNNLFLNDISNDIKLLLHFDGSDESTSFPDSSNYNRTITPVGDVQVDTSEKKFGTGSGLFDGTGDYLTAVDSNDWDFFGNNTDSKTIAYFINFTSLVSGNDVSVSQWESVNDFWEFKHRPGVGVQIRIYESGVSVLNTTWSGAEISDTGVWHHVALVKIASVYAIYIDGVQKGYLSDSSTGTTSAVLSIGTRQTDYLNGYMDEFIFTHNNLYGASPNVGLTDTITVPTVPYSSARQIKKINSISNV